LVIDAVQIRIVAAAHRHMDTTPKAQKAQKAQGGATGEAATDETAW
jgi:hypothetical protein